MVELDCADIQEAMPLAMGVQLLDFPASNRSQR
jgi:hypothetical protein